MTNFVMFVLLLYLSPVPHNLTIHHAAYLVGRSGWTRDIDNFFQWLSAIPFAGGGFNDAAIAEGLADALMVCSVYAHLYCLYGFDVFSF